MHKWSWRSLMLYRAASQWVSFFLFFSLKKYMKAKSKRKGIHKHFRIISVQKQFNQHSPVRCSIKEIWQRLGEFYGMSALDELEEEDEEQESEAEEEEKKRHEFSLPLEEYEQLISEHRQDDQSSVHEEEEEENSPAIPPAKRTRTSKREHSPANSVAESMTSTPEPEEKSSRRTSRGTRKSEYTPEPSTPNSQRSYHTTSRRTGRSSSATIQRGNKRQTNKRK
ncbi:chromatin modification-related protein EAF7-domain-containing protein [Mucor mucedo]|uniref:chromatin modification-related protein EAF7-domain-containing protein n=1 Tax=Mucor mucedo TaxID=29922 RepID=UPI00221F424A|nr:chromatin modification-related protein EAF7-domain-containing protein [Mucor mucedo]KAI7888704.1 chromatin modification-related protein EAF7-domain-containing protein [Mucor mucedo]